MIYSVREQSLLQDSNADHVGDVDESQAFVKVWRNENGATGKIIRSITVELSNWHQKSTCQPVV
jgi:hypothetical protein